MPRKGPATRREIVGDPIYKSVLVTQFVNKLLQRGTRRTAERIMYDALDLVQEKTGDDPVSVLKRAVDNVRPQLEVRSRRVGGANYQVPVEVRHRRATTHAMRRKVGLLYLCCDELRLFVTWRTLVGPFSAVSSPPLASVGS